MVLYVVLPLPPSTNHLYQTVWRFDRHGRRYRGRALSAASRRWALLATTAILRAAHDTRVHPPLALTVRLYLPDRRRRDLDNGIKWLQDTVARALGFDDSAVVEIHASKRIDRERPRCEVEIAEIEPPGGDTP